MLPTEIARGKFSRGENLFAPWCYWKAQPLECGDLTPLFLRAVALVQCLPNLVLGGAGTLGVRSPKLHRCDVERRVISEQVTV
jgi:hypothetical protein